MQLPQLKYKGGSDLMTGKSIRLFLTEGTPHGLICAEIVNWTLRVLVVARGDFGKLARREETRRPGVYLLVGDDPDRPTKRRVYVGESENVLKRLVQHNNDAEKEYWTHTALILSKDDNLTKSHIRFLESRIIRDVCETGRFVLDNSTRPTPAPLPEADTSDMEEFLGQLRILLPVLGFNVMERMTQQQINESGTQVLEQVPIFEMSPVGIHATMRIVDDEFVVQKGSTARKEGVASWTSYRALRDQLVEDGVLVEKEDLEQYVFADDYPFASPSAAAVVYAGNQNGRLVWKLKNTGKSYKDWQEDRLKAVGVDD